MTQDAVRMLAAWLRDATHGVAFYLASVPLETGVTRLASLTVLDECTDPVTALKQVPDTLPVLQVMTTATPLQATAPTVQPFPPNRRVELGVRFATKFADARTAHAQADQVLRALDRSLRQWWRNEAARVRNQVQVWAPLDWRTEFSLDNDDTLLTASLLLTVEVRDPWAAQ